MIVLLREVGRGISDHLSVQSIQSALIDLLRKSDSAKMSPAKSLAFVFGQDDFRKRSIIYQ
jgi:hypothetical protein